MHIKSNYCLAINLTTSANNSLLNNITNTTNNTQILIIDGNFSKWSKWSICSEKCGFSFQSRQRTCNAPTPANGGKPCIGLVYMTSVCPTKPCYSKI